MKQSKISRSAAQSCLFAISLALIAGSNLRADYECRQERMTGVWAETYEAEMLQREGPDVFPPPGPFSFIGHMEIDATGTLIANQHTSSTTGGPMKTDLLEFFDSRLTVNPDCRGTWVYTLRHDLPADHPFIAVIGLERGQVVIELDIVCADGQSECWGTVSVPDYQVGNFQMKKIEPADARLEGRLDRIMRRLGLVP